MAMALGRWSWLWPTAMTICFPQCHSFMWHLNILSFAWCNRFMILQYLHLELDTVNWSSFSVIMKYCATILLLVGHLNSFDRPARCFPYKKWRRGIRSRWSCGNDLAIYLWNSKHAEKCEKFWCQSSYPLVLTVNKQIWYINRNGGTVYCGDAIYLQHSTATTPRPSSHFPTWWLPRRDLRDHPGTCDVQRRTTKP